MNSTGRSPWRPLAALGLLFGTLPCLAGNLVTNPDFATDINGWATSHSGSASVGWDQFSGNPPGALVVSSDAANSSASAQQCVAISAPQDVDFIFDGFVNTATGSGSYTATATAYTSGDCTTGSSGNLPTGTASFPPGGWQGFRVDLVGAALPAGTNSVLLKFTTQVAGAGGTAQYLFDNIRFGPTGTAPVRLQSFEVD